MASTPVPTTNSSTASGEGLQLTAPPPNNSAQQPMTSLPQQPNPGRVPPHCGPYPTAAAFVGGTSTAPDLASNAQQAPQLNPQRQHPFIASLASRQQAQMAPQLEVPGPQSSIQQHQRFAAISNNAANLRPNTISSQSMRPTLPNRAYQQQSVALQLASAQQLHPPGPNAEQTYRPEQPYPAVLPQFSGPPASLPPASHSLPGGAGARPPVIASHRLANQGTLRAHMPQISSQAYIQQASAQLQNFRGGGLYLPFQVPTSSQHQLPSASVGQMRPPMQQGGIPQTGVGRMAAPSNQLWPNGVPNGVGRGQVGASASQLGPVGQFRPPQPQQAGRTDPISGPTANIPQIKRPGAPKVEWLGPISNVPLPGTFTVSDRKVRALPGQEETTPMYILLRQWVQNDPNLQSANPSKDDPGSTGQPLQAWPRQQEPEQPGPEAPRVKPTDPFRTRFAPEELLKVHKEHWCKVRQHHVTRRNMRLNQFRQHLAAIIPDPTRSDSLAGNQEDAVALAGPVSSVGYAIALSNAATPPATMAAPITYT